jgi:hypothetical protein
MMKLYKIMSKCIYCYEEDSATCHFVKCEHDFACTKCILQVVNEHKLPEECPMCRQTSSYITTTCNGIKGCKKRVKVTAYNECDNCKKGTTPIEVEIIKQAEKSINDNRDAIYTQWISKYVEEFPKKEFKVMGNMLDKSKTQEDWIQKFDSFTTDFGFFEKNDNYKRYMFSSDQMDMMGKQLSNLPTDGNSGTYRIFNGMVRMAMYPWLVKTKYYKHGVCYFGNFGEHPGPLSHMKNLISVNYLDKITEFTSLSELLQGGCY